MNTYLIPIDDVNMEGPYIMSVHADSLSDAKDVIEEQPTSKNTLKDYL